MSSQGKSATGNSAVKPKQETPVAYLPKAQEKSKDEPLTMPPAVQELPPLEDRLHRLNQLFDLQKKYSKLHDSLQKLADFDIKQDNERSRLTIMDDSRNSFETYHPEIIREVVAFMAAKIKEKIKALEPQLKW